MKLILLANIFFSLVVFANLPGKINWNLNEEGVILDGNDPTSYFDSSSPQAGHPNIAAEIQGAKFLFRDVKKRENFILNVEKFIPAYGGWCAESVREGKIVRPDLENYTVIDGKLYFFKKGWIFNPRSKWEKNATEFKAKADSNWAKLSL